MQLSINIIDLNRVQLTLKMDRVLISNLFLFPGWFGLHPGMVRSFPWARTSANVCAEGIETDNLICHWAQGGRSPSQTGCLLKFSRPLVLQRSNPFVVNDWHYHLLTYDSRTFSLLCLLRGLKNRLCSLFSSLRRCNLLSAVCLSSTDCLSHSWELAQARWMSKNCTFQHACGSYLRLEGNEQSEEMAG